MPIPTPSRAFVGPLSSCRSRRCGICQKTSARGWNIFHFFLDSYRYFYKEYFQCFEREVWFSFHHHPTPQFFLQPSNNLLPAIVISSHLEEKIINGRLKSSKGETLYLWANGWGRKVQKNSSRYLKANVNFLFCVINATINTLTERFLRDEKIRMLSSSVVYLSFAILNTFDNKKGVIKIVVYSSVIDINQMDVILFARLQAAWNDLRRVLHAFWSDYYSFL